MQAYTHRALSLNACLTHVAKDESSTMPKIQPIPQMRESNVHRASLTCHPKQLTIGKVTSIFVFMNGGKTTFHTPRIWYNPTTRR